MVIGDIFSLEPVLSGLLNKKIQQSVDMKVMGTLMVER